MVINIFNIRERKYEIGVLTAIGMKKRNVCVQFIIEMFIVTIFAMVIGLAAGSVASVPVSNQLLQSQIESQEQQVSDRETNFGRGGGAPSDTGTGDSESSDQTAPTNNRGGFMNQTAQYLSDISATVNVTVVLQLFAVGILLTLISSLVAVVSVMRYEPLQILSNRS